MFFWIVRRVIDGQQLRASISFRGLALKPQMSSNASIYKRLGTITRQTAREETTRGRRHTLGLFHPFTGGITPAIKKTEGRRALASFPLSLSLSLSLSFSGDAGKEIFTY